MHSSSATNDHNHDTMEVSNTLSPEYNKYNMVNNSILTSSCSDETLCDDTTNSSNENMLSMPASFGTSKPLHELLKTISLQSQIPRKLIDSSFSSTSDQDHYSAFDCDLDVDLDSSTGSNSSISATKEEIILDHTNSELHICAKLPNTKLQEATTTLDTISVQPNTTTQTCFTKFRLQYLLVHLSIMLADGLQGTHLYVLYEGYGYSVASLYAIGFVSGAITSPFIGPAVDKVGRKRAAIIYCILEMIINYFEQFPIFLGLILSRVLGGITTNLLFSVFESWLITEHRKKGFEEEQLEIILRDSTIVSNSAAIVSGYLAHCLAAAFGPVGPFEGAVTFTGIALFVVAMLWTENYGKDEKSSSSELLTFQGNMFNAYRTIVGSTKITRIGISQGLTEGALQTFVFLWAPALRSFAANAHKGTWGLGDDGEPSYGLIFGSFMAFGVAGGFLEPTLRKSIKSISKQSTKSLHREGEVDPISVHNLCIMCYSICAVLLIIPCLLPKDSEHSFTFCFAAFLVYELMVGSYMPCEGVLRSIYMPNESICSLMTMLRVIVNVAVAGGVISTNFIPFTFAFWVLSLMMITSACLQMSLLRDHCKQKSEKKDN